MRIGSVANSSVGTVYFVILYGAAHARSTAVWPYALGAMATLAFVAWVINNRRLQTIAKTPISRIDSAAQGFVELLGHAEHLDTTPVISRLTSTPCVWYRYEIKQIDTRETSSETGSSKKPFLLNDDSGHCVIYPEDAEISTSMINTWIDGSYRYTEWLLLPGNDIYACGEFATVHDANGEFDLEGEIDQWLNDLKKDHQKYLDRFDLNHDGEIDAMELGLARIEAQREVEAKHLATSVISSINELREPTDDKPFVISQEPPAQIEVSYQLWNWLHIMVFLVAGISAIVLIKST